MRAFMDKDFLLETETAKTLFHAHAEKMPVIDYHCHINPREIAENLQYDTITQVWLGGDHYKWRAMRCNGIPEAEITESLTTDPFKVFQGFAATLPRAIGNPLYHWAHLELQRYFQVTQPLCAKNAQEIYEHCNKKLAEPEMRVRGLIEQSNVRLICTTDDPIDSLEWHQKIKEDKTCKVQVLPAFRPDKAMNLHKSGFAAYIAKLSEVSGVQIDSFNKLEQALENRIAFFHSMGCRVSDHALDYCVYAPATTEELDALLKKGLTEKPLTSHEIDQFKTAILLSVSRQYHTLGWVMQIHFGCIRDNNENYFQKLGPDTGFDAVSNAHGVDPLGKLLNCMDSRGALPKTILYSLNQHDNEAIMTLAGCFQCNSDGMSRVQLGSAWWFNDTKTGMEKQLTDFANLGVLGNFIGMLTDSRSFLSYTRHEYFRRILCNWLGTQVEKGEYPNDMEALGQLVEDISYNNTVKYFGFPV